MNEHGKETVADRDGRYGFVFHVQSMGAKAARRQALDLFIWLNGKQLRSI
jgi:hypothetical protein